MANSLIFAAAFLTTFVFIQCDEPLTGLDSSLPMLASGKRQHNIMRFGKRPAGGHSLIHFGKRDEPQHRFLFMGKRTDEPDLFHFLQRDDNSYKRGHTIMRFGKRAPPPGSHSFIRFGKREEDGEEDKRSPSGHSMMYFGKRADGHNMMYFGKRGGHSMMYFGKRANELDPNFYVPDEDKTSAAEDLDESKRGSHSMIHFGKRVPAEEEEIKNQLPVFWGPEMEEKRDLQGLGKKAEGSRGSHAMIHFGKRSVSARTKREVEEDDPLFIRPPAAVMWDDVEGPSFVEYGEPEKKDASKNVFLRFG